jgi:hypothetical protein
VDLSIDGVVSAKTSVYTSETGSHKALVPTMTVVNPAAGSHLVTITAALGSLTDTNDSFSYSFIELPPT